MKPTAEDIGFVMAGLFSSMDSENRERYAAVSSLAPVQNALSAVVKGDVDQFYHDLIRPLNNMVDGLLSTALPNSTDSQFLFKHSKFVASHFRTMIEQYEGYACCADKTSTIIDQLQVYLANGKEIQFDFSQKYTFHLPTRVFTNHEEVVTFFKAVHRLYYGKPDLYVQALSKIIARSSVEPSGPLN